MKILLVEDEPGTRQALQNLIEGRGHEVVALETAEEAQSALASQKFPFLILDWMLPGKSGLDLCRELRAQPDGDEMFIWLITARSDIADLNQALEAGANDYLIKPFAFDRLNVRLSVAERQIQEIAERNASRVALRAAARMGTSVLENTAEGFFAVDAEWKFIYVNPKAELLLGCSRDLLIGENLWDKFPEMCGSLFEKNCRRIATENLPLQFEATDLSGKKFFDVCAHPSKGDIFVFFRDITERRQVEEERLKTSKFESLGTLAGGIAHDLNNILTVISGNIGLAQIDAPKEPENVLPFLSKAGQAAEQAANLSNQLLTFARGGVPLKEIVSIAELLKRACEFALRGSNLEADIDIPADLWKADIDRRQIEQVVNALVLNAREAMPDGGTLRLSAHNVEIKEQPDGLLPSGRYLKISINDHGRGIAPELAAKIFDPYVTTKPLGTGLGLSISYSIVKRHGGLLHLESSSPEGSTFVFYLPGAETRPVAPQPPPPKRPFHFNHQRILVMDDDAAVRELTSHLLGTVGYEVTAVPDGKEAIKAYESALRRGQQFQAVILDATVRGGMGGVATIERLRGVDPNVTAIICSGYSDEAALSEFLAYGFCSALPKPFTRGELCDALQRALTSRKLN